MGNRIQALINEFLQTISGMVTKSLSKILDEDNDKKVKVSLETAQEIDSANNLHDDSAIYTIDYLTKDHHGKMCILIPEEMIASFSDIITGGSGDDSYKGTLSELEVNSILNLLHNVFKGAETSFKQLYGKEIAFNTNQELMVKELPGYKESLEDPFFNFLVTNLLTLEDGKKFHVRTLLNYNLIKETATDISFDKAFTNSKSINTPESNLKLLSDVKINIVAQLGQAQVPMKYALELDRGSLVELDTLNNADIKVFANGVEFAQAQVVAIDDSFGLKITKIKSKEDNKKIHSLEVAKEEDSEKEEGVSKPTKKKFMVTIPTEPIDIEAFAKKMENKLFNFDEAIKAAKADKCLEFDSQRAQETANITVQVGYLLNLPDNQLQELWLSGYYHNIGRIKLKQEDFEAQDFKTKQAEESYNLLSSKKMPESVAETSKFWLQSYKTSQFNLTETVPYSHIVGVVAYYEDLIERKQSKEEVLTKMLRIGANKFNPFVLHKFIRLMREMDN